MLFTWSFDNTTWAAAFIPLSSVPPGTALRPPTQIGTEEMSGEMMAIYLSLDDYE